MWGFDKVSLFDATGIFLSSVLQQLAWFWWSHTWHIAASNESLNVVKMQRFKIGLLLFDQMQEKYNETQIINSEILLTPGMATAAGRYATQIEK